MFRSFTRLALIGGAAAVAAALGCQSAPTASALRTCTDSTTGSPVPCSGFAGATKVSVSLADSTTGSPAPRSGAIALRLMVRDSTTGSPAPHPTLAYLVVSCWDSTGSPVPCQLAVVASK